MTNLQEGVISLLSDGTRLSLDEIAALAGTSRGSAACIISRLRHRGLNIRSEWGASCDRYYKKYWIGKEETNEQPNLL